MILFNKNLIGACVFLALTNVIMASDPMTKGTVEGHVKIFPVSTVNLADDANLPNAATEQPYSEYPLIIRSRDGEKEVARITPDAEGNYRLTLPAGDYILD